MATSTTGFSTPFTLSLPPKPTWFPSSLPSTTTTTLVRRRALVASLAASAFRVTVEHQGKATTVEVEEDEAILGKVLDAGVQVPHECQLGVCMTCPAKLLAGEVDQSEGSLGDDVVANGYVHLCASYPRFDCTIRTISEEELASLNLTSTP